MTENVVDQCACWINSTVYIDKIREEKCQAKSHQKKVTDFKKKCTDVFKACKKMEDKSVESVYYCMDDHSLKFINMTKESLAKVNVKRGMGFRDELSLQKFLSEF